MGAWIRIVEELDVIHDALLGQLISSLSYASTLAWLGVIGAGRTQVARYRIDGAWPLIRLEALAPWQLGRLLRCNGTKHAAGASISGCTRVCLVCILYRTADGH